MKRRNQAIKYGAGIALMTMASSVFAVSDYDALTAGINFTDLKAAMGVAFVAMIGAGLFFKGGGLLARKLGWK